MARNDEPFLSRWSRLKREKPAEQESAPDAGDAPAPELPPVESLTPESDFKAFMQPKVKDALRRVALKKLFSDPHFNAPDVFEPFSGDWTVGEPIPEEMLATLNQAQTLLFSEKKQQEQGQETEHASAPDEDKAPAAAPTEQAETLKADEPGSKDA